VNGSSLHCQKIKDQSRRLKVRPAKRFQHV
jgi:hypothetical protein